MIHWYVPERTSPVEHLSRGSSWSRIVGDGPRPKHAQLRDALAELATTELAPDTAIPSERELMTTYDVSRATVRKAIDALVVDGLLHRIHGRGTFVARPRLESRLHLASFSQDMRRRGLTPSTRLLDVELDRPPAEVAAALELDGDAQAWKLDRVRLADDQPIALENGWYPRSLLPGLDKHDLGGSLYELFSGVFDLTIDSAEQTLWGEAADGDDRDPPRRSAAHPAPGLPPGLEGRRQAARVRRVPLPRRPLPDPHVSGP